MKSDTDHILDKIHNCHINISAADQKGPLYVHFYQIFYSFVTICLIKSDVTNFSLSNRIC